MPIPLGYSASTPGTNRPRPATPGEIVPGLPYHRQARPRPAPPTSPPPRQTPPGLGDVGGRPPGSRDWRGRPPTANSGVIPPFLAMEGHQVQAPSSPAIEI